MTEFFTQFHFIRPLWLLALVPALLLCFLLWRKKSQRSEWQQFIPAELLQPLLDNTISKQARWPLYGIALGWILTCFSLAGPAWEKLPQPLHKSQSAVVIVMDLSPSMVAEDIKPSRLIRARYKLTDFLEQRKEGLTALIAYAGEAHVVSPLTDDIDTITNLLSALSPDMMPLRGSNIEMGIDKALQLFKDSGVIDGKIFVVTDSIASEAIPTIEKTLSNTPFELSILGVGTTEGAPIPINDGGFAKDRSGNIVIAKLNQPQLMSLARSLNGVYTPLRADNQDLTLINRQTNAAESPELSISSLSEKRKEENERQFDDWKDQGHWIAILLLPIIALSFRKGWLLSIACLALFIPEPSYAFGWDDLWLRSDQQGQKSLENDDPASAVEQFEDSQWRGSAQYRNKDYEAAAESFAEGNSVNDYYNRGNALAKAGKLTDALDAFDQAMNALTESDQQEDSSLKENIEFNRDLVQKTLDQQKNESDGQPGEEGNPDDSQERNGQQGNQQNSSDQANSDQSSSDESNSSDNSANNSQNSSNTNSDSETTDSENSSSQEFTDNDANSTNDQNNNSEIDETASQELADKTTSTDDNSEKNNDEPAQNIQQSLNQDEEGEEPANASVNAQYSELSNEEKQALEQWLRQVPDDPSGLLRRKFEYQHRQLRQQYQRGQWAPPENDAVERW